MNLIKQHDVKKINTWTEGDFKLFGADKKTFATAITNGNYFGPVLEDLIARTFALAPTLFSFPTQENTGASGSKFKVRVRQLEISETVSQASNPGVYGNCEYTPNTDVNINYLEIPLRQFYKFAVLCAEDYIADSLEKSMPAGVMNDEIPREVREEAQNQFSLILSQELERYFWSTVGGTIKANATTNPTNSTSGVLFCNPLKMTGSLSNFNDVDTIREAMLAVLKEYRKTNKTRSSSFKVFLPIGIWETLQAIAPTIFVDNVANASALLGNVWNGVEFRQSFAIDETDIFILNDNAVREVTDKKSDLGNAGLKRLDSSYSTMNKYEIFQAVRYGVQLVDECGSAWVQLS